MTDPLCKVSIDFDALRYNYALLKQSGKILMPVVKADAYGHGIFESAKILWEEGARHFAVGTVAEAAALREALGARDAFILSLLGCVTGDDCALCEKMRLVPLVHNREGLEQVRNRAMDITLKVDTGMGRLGFRPGEMDAIAASLQGCAVRPVLMLSHLAVADTPSEDAYTMEQFKRMDAARDAVRKYFPEIKVSHGNSSGLLLFPEHAGDIARPGIILYGGNPLRGTCREAAAAQFRTMMTVRTPILSVHPLDTGESLGYGRTFVASRPSVVAWAGIGYADAFRRNPVAGSHPQMAVHGRRCPIIGRVAMQMTALDVTELVSAGVQIRPGDMATVLGNGEIGLQEVADWWGTIPYEVTCLLGKNRM